MTSSISLAGQYNTKIVILVLFFAALLHVELIQNIIALQIPLQRINDKNSQLPIPHCSNYSRIPTKEETAAVVGYVRPEVIYGHIHMAKTAGTEISGELALNFERVCTHKGYSYDFHQVNNKRVKNPKRPPNDVISQYYKGGLHRGRVPHKVMLEIGFEDCDFISHETHYSFWRMFRNWPMEYHVPCREALSHLMSRCNFMTVAFDCNSTNLEAEIAKCDVKMDRFSWEIAKSRINATSTDFLGGLKCYNPIPIEPYLTYISKKLQRKRFKADYVHRSMNKPREKDKECLWKDPELMDRVRKILLKNYEYNQFCDMCMGSENDLLKAAA